MKLRTVLALCGALLLLSGIGFVSQSSAFFLNLRPVSPDGSTIAGGTFGPSLLTADGTWTLENFQHPSGNYSIQYNGVNIASNTTDAHAAMALYIFGGLLYQQTADNTWYQEVPGNPTGNWNGPVTDPRPGTPTAVNYSPNPATVNNTATAGSLVSTMSVAMTSGSYTGSPLAFCSSGCGSNFGNGGGLWAISGNNLNVASTLTSANNGTYHVTVKAVQGSTTVFADLAITVQAPSAGVACDTGSNYPGSVPANAVSVNGVAVNYTKCALHFSTDQPFYQNTANFVDVCGSSLGQWSVFHWGFAYGGGLPCNHITIQTIGGQPTLDLAFLTTDMGSFYNNACADGQPDFCVNQLTWPGTWIDSPPPGADLPMGFYTKMIFSANGPGLSSGATAPGPIDYWIIGRGGYPSPPNDWYEVDFMELTGDPRANYGGGLVSWVGGAGQFDGVTHFTVDPASGFHTLETVVTTDGSSNIAKCTWLDGSGVGCLNFPPQGNSTNNNTTFHQHDNSVSFWVGAGAIPNGSGISSDIHFYVRELDVFTCSGYRTGDCFGNLVTSQ